MVELQARPKVQRISLKPVITSESTNITGIMCTTMTLGFASGNDFQTSVTISPFSNVKELESTLNAAISAVQGTQISLIKTGHNGAADAFWSGDNSMVLNLTLVYITSYEVVMNDIPTVMVTSGPSCTGTDSAQFQLMVAVETIQNLHYPRTFDAGFNNRYTAQLPLNTTAEALQQNLTGLLSWGCTEDEALAEKTTIYDRFETHETARIQNATSFCGVYSSRDPQTIFPADSKPYNLSNVPYVSQK